MRNELKKNKEEIKMIEDQSYMLVKSLDLLYLLMLTKKIRV